MEKSLSYSDVLNTPIYLEFKEKFKWEKIFINITHNLLARKNADGPDLDVNFSPEALFKAMKKSIEIGKDLVIQATKPHVITYADEDPFDEKDIQELVERVRKHPIRTRPNILDCYDHDIYILYVKSYNRHGYDRRKIDLKGNDFFDKRFAEILGEDY